MLSWKAQDVFDAYLSELSETQKAISLCIDTRKSLWDNLNWPTLEADGNLKNSVVKTLKSIPNIRPTLINRSFFLCAHAGFEQFIRELVLGASNSICSSNIVRKGARPEIQAALEKLYGHQIELAGEGFRRYFHPLDHLQIDYVRVASAVVQSSQADRPFVVDGTTLGLRVGNINRAMIEQIFGRFSCRIPWEKLASDVTVQQLLNTSKTRETEKAIADYLEKALAKRNQIAHTQGSSEMTNEDFEKQLEFLRKISSFLFQTLSASITALLAKK